MLLYIVFKEKKYTLILYAGLFVINLKGIILHTHFALYLLLIFIINDNNLNVNYSNL